MDSSNYIKGTNEKRESINELMSKTFDIYPYYISNPVYKSYFNFSNVQIFGSVSSKAKIWGYPPKSAKILAPQIAVINLNRYFKENKYDYDILNSKLFKSNLNLFIKYQERMVKNKILKVNKSAYEFNDYAYNFYLKYKKTITEYLTHHFKNKWWEEGIDDFETEIERRMGNNWHDFGYGDNPFIEYPKRIFKSLPIYLLFLPSIASVIFSKIKLESSYLAYKQKNNLKFYYDYLSLKKILKNHQENITFTRPHSIPKVNYSIDEYLESSDELLSGLNKIKHGKYYYNDNYLKKSSQNLISIPNSTTEFVVFSSQYKSTKADHEMAGYGNFNVCLDGEDSYYVVENNIPSEFFSDSRYIHIRDSTYIYVNERYSNKIDEFFEGSVTRKTRYPSADGTHVIDMPSLYNGLENEGGHMDTQGLIYANMKYYRKNPDNSWNVYIVKPQPVRNQYNKDSDYEGESNYSNIIRSWNYNRESGLFENYLNKPQKQIFEAREDTLMYVIEFDRRIEKIHMVSELGIIESFKSSMPSFEGNHFTPHFDYLNSYFNNPMMTEYPLSGTSIERIMEDYLSIIENKPLNFYQNRGTGILTNYISWKTLNPTINYPKSRVPIKY